MPDAIPEPVHHADRVLYGIHQRVAFSRHLNPCNKAHARAAFLSGAHTPPFQYQPLECADELLRELDAAEPPRDHPAGALVGESMDGTRRLVVALRDRTAEAFDAMARAADWYPEREILELQLDPGAEDEQPLDVLADQLIDSLGRALSERGLDGWTIETDTVMSARVLVDGAKCLLRVHPAARFQERDLLRLVVHEVDVHAVRAWNGTRQALHCFGMGLPGSLATEEGLAMVSEEQAGVSSPGGLYRQLFVQQGIDLARTAGFREVYDALRPVAGPGLAWGICQRIKRGLSRPDMPGVYAKDSVYLRGRMQVRRWLDEGGNVGHLYVGKVGIHDPVEQWISQGWVTPQPVPRVWQDLRPPG